MKPDCIKAVETAIGRTLGAGESARIETRLIENMRELARTDEKWAGMSQSERLAAAAQRSLETDAAQATKAAQRKASNIAAQVRETEALSTRAGELGGKNSFHKALFQRLQQLDNYIAGVRSELFGNALDALKAAEPRFLGLLENAKAVDAFVREVLGEKTGNKIAEKGAKAYLESMEKIRTRENAAGADIGKLDYGYLPQPHDTGAIVKAGKDAWVSKVMPLMDRERFLKEDGSQMTDAELGEALAHAYDTLSTEGLVRREAGAGGRGSRASRSDEAHRVLHFKDADSYLSYFNEFGRGSVFEAIHNHLNAHAKNIAMMEAFGANPTTTYKLLKDTAEIEDSGAAGKPVKGVTKFLATPDMVWETINGDTATPVNPRGAAIGRAIRNHFSTTRLGGIMLSSINDAPMWLATARYNGVPLGKALRQFFSSIASGSVVDDGARLGLAVDSIAGEMQTWHAGNMRQDWTGKLANSTMKLQLVESWTHRLRAGLGLMLQDHLATLKDTEWDALSAFDRDRMKAGGITAKDWKVWQAATPENIRGRDLLTANAIRNADVAKVDQALGGEITAARGEAQAHIDELNSRNAQDAAWLDQRRSNISQWLQKAQTRISDRLARRGAALDEKTTAAVERLAKRISKLEESVEASAGAWAHPEENAPGIDSSEAISFYGKPTLRKLGKQEGAALEAIDFLSQDARQLKADTAAAKESAMKAELGDLFSQFEDKRAEIADYAKRADERAKRRQFVMDRIARDIEPRVQAMRDSAINHATAAMLGFIDNEAKTAVLAPDAITRAAITQGAKAGTFGGELGRSVMLFKSFPLAMMLRNIDRLRSIPTAKGKIAYSFALMTTLTLMGALSLELKDLVSGKNPRDATNGKFWGAAFAQGGGLGIFGDMLYTGLGGNSRAGNPNWTNLGGPVLGGFADLANVTVGNLGQALQGKDTKAAAELLRFTRSNLPFLNLWYLKAAIDHMGFNELQENVSPGYLARQRMAARRDWGTSYWWEPNEFQPSNFPEMAAAVGR